MRPVSRTLLVALFAVALIPRLLYLASIPQAAIVESVDAKGYALLARNLRAGHGLSLQDAPPYRPDGLRTPLYPALVTALYTLFGERPVAVAVAQAVLDSLTALLVGGMAGALLGRRAGIAGALLYALSPLQWRYAAALLTEVPLAFLVALATSLLVRLLVRDHQPRGLQARSEEQKKLLACGAVAGLVALCKPNLAGLALILALAAAWAFRAKRRRALGSAGCILLAAAAVASPWVIRNWAVFGSPFLSNAHLGFIARVSAPATLGVVRGHRVQPWSPEWERRYVEVVSQAAARHNWQQPAETLTPRQAHQREVQVAEAARQVLQAHPLETLQAHLVGFVRSWAPQEQTFWYTHLSGQSWQTTGVAPNAYRDAVEILCAGRPGEAFEFAFLKPWDRLDPFGRILWYGWGVGHLLAGGLIIAGLWQLRRRPALALALATTILYATLPPGPIGYERFRVPVVPLITVLEVAGMVWFSRRVLHKPARH